VAVGAVDTFNVLAVAVVTVALPTLSHLVEVSSGRSRRLAERGFRYLAAAILPIAAVGTVVAGPVLGFAFGETFSASGAPAAILLWAHWSAFAWLLARSVLIAGDRTGVLAGLAVAAAAVNVALNLVLIPDHGAEGAAVASLVAYATPLVVGLWVPASRPVFTAAVRAGVRPVAAALVVLAALYAMDRAGVPAIGVVAAAAVVAPVAVLATRALTIGEVRELAVSSLRRQGGRR